MRAKEQPLQVRADVRAAIKSKKVGIEHVSKEIFYSCAGAFSDLCIFSRNNRWLFWREHHVVLEIFQYSSEKRSVQ
jgi:hypothetical protein